MKTNEEIFEAIQLLATQMDTRFDEVHEEIASIKLEMRRMERTSNQRIAEVHSLIYPLHERVYRLEQRLDSQNVPTA